MEVIVYHIEVMAQKWLSFIFTSSLQVSFYLILIFLISFLARNHSAKFLYTLWMIGLLRILIPPGIRLPNFLTSPDFMINERLAILSLPEISSNTIGSTGFTYQGYLFLLWMTVVICLLILWLYKDIQFNRFVKSCRPLGKDLLRKWNLFGENEKLNVQLYAGSQIITPFTRGLFSPKIYLPEHALSWSVGEWKAIIFHEWAHIKRKDIFFIALQNMIQVIYFFHPLVWFANIQISRYREKACDDFAIHAMHGNSLDYGKYLLNSVDQFVQWQPLPSISNYFHQSRKFLLKRFEYILNRKEDIMIKLNLIQKLVLACLVGVAVALSCQKDNGKQTTGPMTKNGVTSEQATASLQSDTGGSIEFVPYDEPPFPVGGFAAIQKNLHYPEIARKAGKEGKVIVYVKIDENGNVADTKIIKSLGSENGCDEAAIEALKSVKWTPAQQKGRPVAVWVSVPVIFRLK